MTASQTAAEIRSITFDDLPLAPFLKETISSVGYVTPTPIQEQAIPLVIEGRDLIGLAQTGTGKTAAFILPILQKLSGSKEKATRALILAPTRELAEQINDVIKMFAGRTGIKSCTVYGGVSHRNQIGSLRGKPGIVVACPGRLKDHMQGRTVDLSQVDMLVLDEADRMLDMGFLPDIKHIIKALPAKRQTMLFSATMPDEIQVLTKEVLNNPTIVRVKTELALATVSHSMYTVQQTKKPETLSAWIRDNSEALVVVFTKMKHTAKRLGEKLADNGVKATSLHGNLSQAQRSRALAGFKDGYYRVMIATDIAARGIDVEGITHVVNYDMPDTLDAYIHRTGRAGRASRTGDALSFVTRDDLQLVRSIERWLKAPITRLNAAVGNDTDTNESSIDMGEARERRAPRGAGGRSAGGRSDDRRGAGRPAGRGGERSAPRAPRAPRAVGRDERSERPAPSFGGERRERSSSDRPSFSSDRPRGRSAEGVGSRAPVGERRERPARDGGSSERFARPDRGFGGDRGRNDRRGGDRQPSERPQREFRGQQDIQPDSQHVFRPKESHFIDRSEPRTDRPQAARGGRGVGGGGFRRGSGNADGARSEGPRGPRSSGPRSSGPRSSGPRSSGPRSSGPRDSQRSERTPRTPRYD